MRKFNALILLFCLIGVFSVNAQQEAPSWVDFASKRLSGDWGTNTIPDFSFAGYKFSEENIPSIAGWNVVDVTDHGANPGDSGYDDAGIKNAIQVAENSNVPTVVFFPRGRYRIHSSSTANQSIEIKKSNIVLKGEGSGAGGTEIFADKLGEWAFNFRAPDLNLTTITKSPGEIKRGAYTITVNSTANLSVGQIVELTQHTTSNVSANGVRNIPNSGGSANPHEWGMKRTGMNPVEKHLITAINGNKVTFKNPVMLNMPADGSTELRRIKLISGCGVEDIRFTGNWPSIGEDFVHHKNDIHDYGWRGFLFENVYNSWVKNCEFKDWNEGLEFQNCIAITIQDSDITGKRAHSSFTTKFCSGLLFQNIEDRAGTQHGLSARRNSSGIVFTEYKMKQGQSVDFHGSSPYANLLENTSGTFDRNGGNTRSYPNAGPYNTFWNFVHDATYGSRTFNFWSTGDRKLWTFANPIFVGFTSPGESITFQNEGKNELKGAKVYPYSLFDAQLQLRLYGAYMSASNHGGAYKAVRANDKIASTRWESAGNGTNQWLQLDFGVAQSLDKLTIDEVGNNVQAFKLEYWDNNSWKDLTTGTTIGANKVVTFNSVTTRKIRLTFTQVSGGNKVAIKEFGTGGTIVNPTNNPPVGNFTNPTFSTIEEGYEDLYVKVDASDPDGDEITLLLKINGSDVRVEGNPPYEWGHVSTNPVTDDETQDLVAGEYLLEVVITDSKGASTTISKSITVTEIGVSNFSPIHDAYTEGALGKNDQVLRIENGNRNAYLLFDVSSVMPAVLEQGILSLTVSDDNGNGTLRIYDANGAWTEGTINASNAPVKGAQLATKNGDFTIGNTYEFDVKNMNVVDGKVAFRMEMDAGGNDVSFASKDQTLIAKPNLKLKVNDVVSYIEGEVKEFITVFPNPSGTGVFHLSKSVYYEVHTLLGDRISEGKSDLIDISNFPNGVYILEVEGQSVKISK